ncbi:MAG: hypothetical protein ACLSF6_03300 [Evtepia gabavorous]
MVVLDESTSFKNSQSKRGGHEAGAAFHQADGPATGTPSSKNALTCGHKFTCWTAESAWDNP